MSHELNEDSEMSADELLDWQCWKWAIDAESLYPPDESEGVEYAVFVYSAGCFEDVRDKGFDPVTRTERHIEQRRSEGLDLEDIDWTWWEAWNGEE